MRYPVRGGVQAFFQGSRRRNPSSGTRCEQRTIETMLEPDKNVTGGSAPKLLGSLRLKVRLAAAATAVLVAGALLAPKAAPTAVPASQERPVPLLEQEVQRREPVRLFRPVQEIARQIIAHNVTAEEIDRLPKGRSFQSIALTAPAPAASRSPPVTIPPNGTR